MHNPRIKNIPFILSTRHSLGIRLSRSDSRPLRSLRSLAVGDISDVVNQLLRSMLASLVSKAERDSLQTRQQ